MVLLYCLHKMRRIVENAYSASFVVATMIGAAHQLLVVVDAGVRNGNLVHRVSYSPKTAADAMAAPNPKPALAAASLSPLVRRISSTVKQLVSVLSRPSRSSRALVSNSLKIGGPTDTCAVLKP